MESVGFSRITRGKQPIVLRAADDTPLKDRPRFYLYDGPAVQPVGSLTAVSNEYGVTVLPISTGMHTFKRVVGSRASMAHAHAASS